jgi:hypothetical protein
VRIPDTIRIGAQDYSVSVSDVPGSHGNFGECNHSKLTIEIDSSSPPPRQQQTFIHEIVEALDFELNIGLKHHQVELLEGGLYGLIRDNPGLFGGGSGKTR